MKQRAITLIKKADLNSVPGSATTPHPEREIDLDRSVGDWITERRENDRLERIDSGKTVAAWKILPDTT